MRKILTAAMLTLGLLAQFFGPTADAREGWHDRPGLVCNPKEIEDAKALATCRKWISEVKRPDKRSDSCCGEGDAFIADRYVLRDGKYFAIITEDYPPLDVDDGEGGTTKLPGVPLGTEIEIPPEKFNNVPEDGGNPSGHGVVFMRTNGEVLCYLGLSGA